MDRQQQLSQWSITESTCFRCRRMGKRTVSTTSNTIVGTFHLRLLSICPWADRLYLKLQIWRGQKMSARSFLMDIPDEDHVARHVFGPSMGTSADNEGLINKNFFMFASQHGGVESLVWRKFAPDAACVHSIGRATARRSNRAGKTRPKKYLGFRGANVSQLRSYRSLNGFRFFVEHAPEEGVHHVHIARETPNGSKLPKPDRSEMLTALVKLFRDVVNA